MLVQTKRVAATRPPGRPAARALPSKWVVAQETLATSRLSADLLTWIEDKCLGSVTATTMQCPRQLSGALAIYV